MLPGFIKAESNPYGAVNLIFRTRIRKNKQGRGRSKPIPTVPKVLLADKSARNPAEHFHDSCYLAEQMLLYCPYFRFVDTRYILFYNEGEEKYAKPPALAADKIGRNRGHPIIFDRPAGYSDSGNET